MQLHCLAPIGLTKKEERSLCCFKFLSLSVAAEINDGLMSVQNDGAHGEMANGGSGGERGSGDEARGNGGGVSGSGLR